MNRLHEQVRAALKASGISQRSVADELEVSPQQVSNWLCGRSLMTERQVRAIARMTGRTPEDWALLALIERAGQKHPRGRERVTSLLAGGQDEWKGIVGTHEPVSFQLSHLPCTADVETFTVPAPSTSPYPKDTILVCSNSRPRVDGARVLAHISDSWRVVDYVADMMRDTTVYRIIDEQ